MSWQYGEEIRCGSCRKPKKLSQKSREAVAVYRILASRREWDGMSGMPRPLRISDVRAEALNTEDPDASTARVVLLDGMWMEREAERRKRESKR